MKIRANIVLVSIFGFILVQQCLSEEVSNNWTCMCISSQDQSSVLASNCSTLCDCRPDETHWTCVCPANGFPKVTIDDSDSSCFTSCKCSAGAVGEMNSSKKQTFPRKLIWAVLILCVVLTTMAFLATMVCYICRKNKLSGESSLFPSDRDSSCHSSANLITRKSIASQPKTSISYSVTGCFQNASFFCVSRPETLHGTITRFSFTELEQATDKFSNNNLIGIGGSSCVYRGRLKDGKIVAIKHLTSPKDPENHINFSTEVELLSRLNHFHVVPLIGYCLEFRGKHTERLLVFEYMPNGNLRDCLDGELGENLTWDIRVSIAMGAARGLEYLHEAAAPKILHRDVKSTNILLDDNLHAKITDLGMAQSLSTDDIKIGSSSPASLQGTFGYFAPEYAIAGCASSMSDVFSFGVVLLELITGRKPIQKPRNNKGEESLVIWATPRLLDSKRVMSELCDLRLKGKLPEEEMQIMAYLARECLLLDPDSRPTMREVVQILSTIAPPTSRCRSFPLRLLQLPSSAPTNNIIEEEAVDLTEPRLESFCVSQTQST